ncbi:MAG: restriction endonuclease [Patescibacteria group bacterium]|jgi:restriction system protein
MSQARYQQLLTNELTKETVLIKSNDPYTFQAKLDKRKALWEKQNQRLRAQRNKQAAVEEAETRTQQAMAELETYRGILRATLTVDDRIEWSKLVDTTPFRTYQPQPKLTLKQFQGDVPAKGLFDVLPFVKAKRVAAEQAATTAYNKAIHDYEAAEAKRQAEYEREKAEYLKQQQVHNDKLKTMQQQYEAGTKEGVEQYINLVLERSKYPEALNLYPVVHYDPQAKVLLVDMDLPNREVIPHVVAYKYVAAKREVISKDMTKKEFEACYNDVLYQITLRTIHEVCESDYQHTVELIVFNGWVEGVNPKTGQEFRNCILSVQVDRKEFEAINLERIVPQECFKHLKGVSAGSLVNLAPVRPIMVMNTEDKRIIAADNVLDGLDSSTNLATMDWQQFEVLVRDLIQKEFAREGCKVEVTQASRDAGVDAIAFDEDPIRGGKYVIQAKRYNNIVPVSAVRDLFGTVHNEGAVKGILITTSYYGKDSLEFAKNKPLKLINGEELIYMFNKHGYQLKIELQKKQKAASSVSY